MIPKSTVKLVPGDYCLIPLSDGKSVVFAFLRSVPGMRSYFYGALLAPAFNPTVETKLPADLQIVSQAMVHIKCFSDNNTPVVGNAAEEMGESQLIAAQRACTDLTVGTSHRVWSSGTVLRRAEMVRNQKD
jgi:hypothetical protein